VKLVNSYLSRGRINLGLDIENISKEYRNKLDIIKDILLVAEEAGELGSKKTHLMYGANLSYKLLTRYLAEVLTAGLICKGELCYFITEKGRKFLKFYKDYRETCSEIKEHVDSLNNDKKILEKMLCY
jgi:predicted transcriptional regulator